MPRLYKKEKLCSEIAIAALFAGGDGSALAFPLRAVWRLNPGRRSDAAVQMLISIPKKKLRLAVDRVKMRRRVREAYRLERDQHPMPAGAKLDVAFIYVDKALQPWGKVQRAMQRLLSAMAKQASQAPAGNEHD